MPVTWNSSETAFVVAAGSVAFCFFAHWIITQSKSVDTITNNLKSIVFQRYSGLVLLGIVPSLAMFFIADWRPQQFGINGNMTTDGWVWLGALSVVFVLLSYFNSPRPDNLALYPQVRKAEWDTSTFFHEYTSWVFYLIGYETLFRGIFLFACASVMTPWSAIALMALVNSLSHIPKGPKETIISLPGSVLFGYITLSTGSIWVSVALHSVMALSTSWFSFRAHPGMHIKRR